MSLGSRCCKQPDADRHVNLALDQRLEDTAIPVDHFPCASNLPLQNNDYSDGKLRLTIMKSIGKAVR